MEEGWVNYVIGWLGTLKTEVEAKAMEGFCINGKGVLLQVVCAGACSRVLENIRWWASLFNLRGKCQGIFTRPRIKILRFKY